MKVLILVTAFNVENFIEKVILRLPDKLKKGQLDFEILIIDDASNDNTLKEIISIRDKYKDHKITCLSNKVNLLSSDGSNNDASIKWNASTKSLSHSFQV